MVSELKPNPVAEPGVSAASIPAAIDASCRLPLLVLFLGAAFWLLAGSVLALIASIKFHSPTFLADSAWLTYGRLQPAGTNALLYGFSLQAGLGVGLWLLARLGRTVLAPGWLVVTGAGLLNLGLAIGLLGVLAGDSTGYETLELPRYAMPLVFVGYLLIALWSLLAFHQRRERPLFVTQWFVVVALFWFAWIYSTAGLLLANAPVRGVTQAIIAWWFGNNVQYVWAWLVGLGALFYFLPKLAGRELHSRYLALFTFWLLLLFSSWGGIPPRAPVPAWMPALSSAMTVLTLVPVVAVALIVRGTFGRWMPLPSLEPAQPFFLVGVAALLLAGLARALAALPAVSQVTDLTWFGPARETLNLYGFFAMVCLGAIYYIGPRLTGQPWPAPKLVQVHFWLAVGGVALTVLPLAVGGIVQGFRLVDATVPFAAIEKGNLHFLRLSTMGGLLLVLGHLCLAWNLAGAVSRFYRAQFVGAYAAGTASIATAGVKS